MDTRPIRFVHRGRVVSVQHAEPTRTLLDWLREDARCTGTKEGCAEGDCGACTVLVGSLDAHGAVQLKPVNACIQFVPALDGKAVLTVEDLTAAGGAGLHPVQQAMVECHGSQCGFCTPGFVMSLAATYEKHCAGGTRPTRAELADDLSGNLCRCTGYRPILDAGRRMFELPARPLPLQALAPQLKSLQADAPLGYEHGGRRFWAPRTLSDFATLRQAHPEARILAGCTDIGLWVNKQMRELGDLLFIGEVAELKRVEAGPGLLRIGAAVTLEDAWAALAAQWPTLRAMGLRFASPPVRNAGTLVGNLANGSPIGDGAPVLIALDAVLLLRRGAQQRRLPLQDFYVDYMKNRLAPGEFVEAVEVPLPSMTRPLRAYKVAKRFDSDISAVAAGLCIELQGETVRDARFAFGGLAAIVKRAANAERAVVGQPWTETTVTAAMRALQADFAPLTDLRASAAYRAHVAQQLLKRFWLQTRPQAPLSAADVDVWHEARAIDASAPPVILSAAKDLAMQTETPALEEILRCAPDDSGPGEAGTARPHESAALHVTGRAAYVDDLPEPAGTLHAALGLSPLAHGRLLGIDVERLRALPGVVDVIAAQDIPGRNDCGPIVHDDPILAEGELHYLGQPVFAVIAETRAAARRAAALAREVIRCEPLPAVLSVREAHAQQRYVLPPMHLTRGDPQAAIAAAPHRLQGSLTVGGQEQFYLEGQVSFALPADDGGLHLHCSTQHPSEMQMVVAHACGLQAHHVRVECRRMGGGFGGKESQSALFACVAGVAAQRLQRPVKLRLDRDDDFLATGRRHGFEYDYEVGFDGEGRILGVEVTMIANAGFSADLSGPVMTRAICHFDNAYWLPHVAIHGYLARTNTQSNTAFRGFGGPQGAIAIENILERIARRLHRDPAAVRRANYYGVDTDNVTPYRQVVQDNVIHDLAARLLDSSDYAARRLGLARFNAMSPVLKKGLAFSPVKFGISFNVTHLNQAGALVHVYQDGSILVNHGGTEMGQGLNTKVAQVVAHELGVPFERVRVTATDTSKVANTSATAASTGSDLNGKAAQDAARQVRERLAALAAQLHGGSASEVRFADGTVHANGTALPFCDLVARAYLERVQLWSDGFYATPGLHWDRETLTGRPFYYYAYGAAVSEVLLDTLTGEWRLLRADLLHDVGRSLNPAIDLGQVEGGFVQGMGWLTTEELVWHPQTGALLTHAPSTYKIPTANDVPAELHVQLYDNRNAEDSIHRSKAVGEPPLLLAFSVWLAIRDAVAAALGPGSDPRLDAPATPEAILRALGAVR